MAEVSEKIVWDDKSGDGSVSSYQESRNSQIKDSDYISTENLTAEAKHAESDQKVGSTSSHNEKIENESDVDSLPTETILSFLRHGGPDEALCCHCRTKESENIRIERKGLINEGSVSCCKCRKTMQVDPWWMVNECRPNDSDVKEGIVQFMEFHNQDNRSFCKENCNKINRFKPSKKDRFGIVSSVVCKTCNTEVPLEMNTANSHTLTVIDKAEDLNPGDEIMFRRWYGISHHAIYLAISKHDEENKGCCNSCRKFFCISDEEIHVISHTFNKTTGDGRVMKSSEWLQGGIDVYRVEYDSCYPPKWTELIAKRAEQYATDSQKTSDSSYDPLMENCEHFARRCKTGQSESRQVKTCLYHCGTNIAMLFLRMAIVAIWWISAAASKGTEASSDAMNKMEVIAATCLCILFTIVKVIVSSILECRNLRGDRGKTTEISGPSCGRSCSTCCPSSGLRYLCTLLCCLVPIRLCMEIYYNGFWTRCSCHFKCNQCCEDPILKFCCRQYVVIVLRVLLSEVIVIGIPVAFFAIFEQYCVSDVCKTNSLTRAALGFAFTFPIALVLSLLHSCIRNISSRCIGWFCLRCCCCCYCCCSFKDSRV